MPFAAAEQDFSWCGGFVEFAGWEGVWADAEGGAGAEVMSEVAGVAVVAVAVGVDSAVAGAEFVDALAEFGGEGE